ncbi:hypothetical protein EZV62_001213 [Acer yangbiense]|uniref:Uncharacterized protein n=1 Tax=Acer yangbiense TaxID=1000413 RepID=A0A5C7IUV2_9ROSI|nr:hypothetical protein EZV62_001213 [Acer yangbiense]
MGVCCIATKYPIDAKVKVLTLKNNSWRQIQGVDNSVVGSIYGLGTLSNNALHWIGEQDFNYFIVSFDLSGGERFKELGLPDHLAKERFLVNLGTIGDSLVIFCYLEATLSFKSWVMKEYGVKSSWTRLFRVSNDTFPYFNFGVTLKCITKQGKVVLQIDGSELILYSPEEEPYKEFGFKNYWGRFESVVYEESLVSLNGQ